MIWISFSLLRRGEEDPFTRSPPKMSRYSFARRPVSINPRQTVSLQGFFNFCESKAARRFFSRATFGARARTRDARRSRIFSTEVSNPPYCGLFFFILKNLANDVGRFQSFSCEPFISDGPEITSRAKEQRRRFPQRTPNVEHDISNTRIRVVVWPI